MHTCPTAPLNEISCTLQHSGVRMLPELIEMFNVYRWAALSLHRNCRCLCCGLQLCGTKYVLLWRHILHFECHRLYFYGHFLHSGVLLYTLSALVCTWLTCFCNLIILSLPKGKCRIKMCSMHTQAKEHHLTHAPGTKTRLEKNWSALRHSFLFRWHIKLQVAMWKLQKQKQVNGSLFAVALPLLPVTNTGRSHRREHILFNSLPADFPVPATQSESSCCSPWKL